MLAAAVLCLAAVLVVRRWRLRAVLRAVAGGWDRAVGWDRADRTVDKWSERAVESRAVDGATSIGVLETVDGWGARAP